MKKRIFLILASVMATAVTTMAQATFDTQQPFGFVTMSSRTDASSTYNFTAGGTFTNDNSVASTITLTATGNAMNSAILNAIKNYSVIILDGSKGDFILSTYITLNTLSKKTIIGINNARICTQWYVTDEIKAALDAANVKSASTSSGTGGTFLGEAISEAAELLTRQTIYGILKSETYRSAGCFYMKNCSNIAIRNIKFIGPGSVDCGGKCDLISCVGSNHIWVDHCDFVDGIDGNFDITNSSDFVTVSWCTFSYTDRAYMHENTNLVGSSDSEATGYLNTTFAYNVWGQKCNERMPMARVGKIHMLNNYFNCGGAAKCINPRKNSEFLIEGNYFESDVKNIFSQKDATAYVWQSDNAIASKSASAPASSGSVTVPYSYQVQPAADMPAVLAKYSGATLFGSSSGIDAVMTDNVISDGIHHNIIGQKISTSVKGVHIVNGRKIIVK